MSHTSRSQESQRKHSKTPDGNDAVLRLLERIRSEEEPVAEIVRAKDGSLTAEWSADYIPNKGDKLYLKTVPRCTP